MIRCNLIKIIVGLVALSNFATCQFPGCDFFQQLRAGVRYQIFSPGFDRGFLYPPNTRCRWAAEAPPAFKVRLECDYFEIPPTTRCTGDAFIVSSRGRADLGDGQRYCGTGQINFESDSTQMVVSLQSTSNSRGGRVRCFFTAVPNNCMCGIRNRGRIVGGTETLVNEYPNMAGLIDTRDRAIICGASIISQTHALSAAHCSLGRSVSILGLLAGDHNISTGGDTPHAALYRVAEFVRHPNYNQNSGANDIGLIRTSTVMVFNRGVGPICLPFKFRGTSFERRTVIAAGWGHDDFGGRPSDVLMHVILNVVSSNRCSATQMCTFTPGRDACQHDSGGPLMFVDGNGLLYSVGVISEGIACATNNHGINTRVTEYLDWIQQITPQTVYCNR